MTVTIGRRELLAALGGAAAAWPLAARAQQVMPVVGYLDFTNSLPNPIVPPAFREGLAAAGFVEGRNVTIERASPGIKGSDWRSLRQNLSSVRWP